MPLYNRDSGPSTFPYLAMKLSLPIILAAISLERSGAFQQQRARVGWAVEQSSSSSSFPSYVPSPLFDCPRGTGHDFDQHRLLHRRFNTLTAAGLRDGLTAGGGIGGLVRTIKKFPQDVRNLTWKDVKPIKLIKGLHGPITYIILGVFLATKYTWMWRSRFFWLAFAFCVKWIRARYLFKIPVWDRQPNWNNIITSKDQEKDLKAYTCKTCGSTLFIAKTREFFFEGSTGFGGLGCFSCGAKGADNFVMDRDRIVEDVADMDDYFEYERPLDFVSAGERRALLKEAKGDEEQANKILVERTNALASTESQAAAEAAVNGSKVSSGTSQQLVPEVEAEEEDTVGEGVITPIESKAPSPVDDDVPEESKSVSDGSNSSPGSSTSSMIADVPSSPSDSVDRTPKQLLKKPKGKKKKPVLPPPQDDDLDFLGMDD